MGNLDKNLNFGSFVISVNADVVFLKLTTPDSVAIASKLAITAGLVSGIESINESRS